MHIVGPQTNKHRLVVLSPHEGDGLVSKSVSQVFTLLAGLDCRDPVWIEIRWRPTQAAPADVHIEPLVFRPKTRAAACRVELDWFAGKVPLAEEAGCVAGFPETLSNGNGPERQYVFRGGWLDFPVFGPEGGTILAMLGDMQPRGSQPGDQRAARGRADWRRRISMGEANPLPGQPVEPGCVQAVVALAAQIHPAQVINHDEQHMRGFGPGHTPRQNSHDSDQDQQSNQEAAGVHEWVLWCRSGVLRGATQRQLKRSKRHCSMKKRPY